MKARNIAIVLGRCTRDKGSFGLRLERAGPETWQMTWAFAIKETVAKKEGYDCVVLEGSFDVSESYPGCPHCGAGSIFRCSDDCGVVGCWDGRSRQVRCPGCGQMIELGGDLTSLDAGSDR
jgi:hypothetical protein